MISNGDTGTQRNYQNPPEVLGALLLLATTLVTKRKDPSDKRTGPSSSCVEAGYCFCTGTGGVWLQS